MSSDLFLLKPTLPALIQRADGRRLDAAILAIGPAKVCIRALGLEPGEVLTLELDELGATRGELLTRDEAGGTETIRLPEVGAEAFDALMTRLRKLDHIRICLDEAVAFQHTTTGLERWRLPHRALPEVDLRAIDTRVEFLGRELSAPLMIGAMTGGASSAARLNAILAEAAESRRIAFALGSMKILIHDRATLPSFDMRERCPSVPLIGNIGAVSLNYGVTPAHIDELFELTGVDAMAIHLNPLQEAIQPEGDVDFSGLRRKLEQLLSGSSRRYTLKETGCGIDEATAHWAAGAGFSAIETSGAGGTSWSRVESFRTVDERRAELGRLFGEWGLPTADSIIACRRAAPGVPIVASGGMRTGLDLAKSIALGAGLAAISQPFLSAALEGVEAVGALIDAVITELRVAMFCAGAPTVAALSQTRMTRLDPPC